jgi:hypothetical protein
MYVFAIKLLINVLNHFIHSLLTELELLIIQIQSIPLVDELHDDVELKLIQILPYHLLRL